MFDDKVELDEKLEIEIGKSLWKFDGPIGRLRFFMIQLSVLIGVVAVIFVKSNVIPYIHHCPVDMLKFLLVVILLLLWTSYMAIAKRIYDIFASKKMGIIFSVLLFFTGLFIKGVAAIFVIALMFIPGKMIKNNF